MTPEQHALGLVIDVLERRGVPCIVTGSVATSYHGHPRATHDVDIVVDPTPDQLEMLIGDLDRAGFDVDMDGAARRCGAAGDST